MSRGYETYATAHDCNGGGSAPPSRFLRHCQRCYAAGLKVFLLLEAGYRSSCCGPRRRHLVPHRVGIVHVAWRGSASDYKGGQPQAASVERYTATLWEALDSFVV